MNKKVKTIISSVFLALIICGVVPGAFAVHEKGLIEAAGNGNWADVRSWILKGANVNASGEYGQTPLMLAIVNNNYDAVEFLLKNDANIEARDYLDRTPLRLAAEISGKLDNIKIVRLLLQYGAKIDDQSKIGCTALMEAARSGNAAIVRLLISYSAGVRLKTGFGHTALHWAAESGCTEAAGALLDKDPDIIDAFDVYGETPLIYAIKYKRSEMVKFLIERGANRDAIDRTGKTALWIATELECSEIQEYLKSSGATSAQTDRGVGHMASFPKESVSVSAPTGAGQPLYMTDAFFTSYVNIPAPTETEQSLLLDKIPSMGVSTSDDEF